MTTTHIVFSGVLTFGIPLALVVGQAVVWWRRPRGGGNRPLRPPEPQPPKPLPDCLIPRPMARRTPGPRPTTRRRVLEDA